MRAEKVSASKDVVTLSLSGKGLDKKDWFGKSDPQLTPTAISITHPDESPKPTKKAAKPEMRAHVAKNLWDTEQGYVVKMEETVRG